MDTYKADSLNYQQGKHEEMASIGRSVHQLTAVPKNWQDSLWVDDNNHMYFIIFPTAVFFDIRYAN